MTQETYNYLHPVTKSEEFVARTTKLKQYLGRLSLVRDTLTRQVRVMILNTILVGIHVTVYIFTAPIRASIYFYIKRKPLGLQSVLDLMILDLLRVYMLNYTFMMCFVTFPGYFHGHLPYVTSQVIIFILDNILSYFFGLLQCFLITKAILVFKGYWLNEVPDSSVIWSTRFMALVITIIRFVGDFMVTTSREGNIVRFLTGTNAKR